MDDDRKLSRLAWSSIETAERVYVSSASLWEASIKFSLGTLRVDPERLIEAVSASGFLELPVTLRHTLAVRSLPNMHRDPFDQLLLAQAISEPLHLLTADPQLEPYTALVQLV